MVGKILVSSFILASSLLASDGWLIKGIVIEKNGVTKNIKFKDKANVVTIKDDVIGSVWVKQPKYKHTINGFKKSSNEINELNKKLKSVW